MTLAEAKKQKPGMYVLWPEGANYCSEAIGIVTRDESNDALFVAWPDGQRTYLHDKDAIQFIRAVQS